MATNENADRTQTVDLTELQVKTHPPALADVLEAHRGERHVIVLQDFPDPDAISSAFAHRLISAEHGIQADILYSGHLSHQQNTALVKLLGITIMRYTDAMELDQYDGVVFVDNQGTTSREIVKALEAADVPTLIVVDHHEAQNEFQVEYADIRRMGATATIYAQYLEQGLVEMDRSRKEHMVAATALMHGILSDTGNFVRAKYEDFLAAAFLSQFADANLLEQIMHQARSKQTMEIIREALGNRTIIESFSIAGVGYLRAVDRDAIPQAADFLLTEENVHTALVYGIVTTSDGDESLVGSMRTTKLTLDLDEFIKEIFGKDASGRYFGGGRLTAGGFEIPLGFLAGGGSEEFIESKWQVYDTQIRQKLLATLGVQQESGK